MNDMTALEVKKKTSELPPSYGWQEQGFPNFSAADPQNNGARNWGPLSTVEVAYNVKHTH